jgi:hypothetical protein
MLPHYWFFQVGRPLESTQVEFTCFLAVSWSLEMRVEEEKFPLNTEKATLNSF